MPIYEYKCEKCGYKFEKLVLASSGEPKVGCPRCQSELCRKVVSTSGSLGGLGTPPARPPRRRG